MKNVKINFREKEVLTYCMMLLFLIINSLFIVKYVPRLGVSIFTVLACVVLYAIISLLLFFVVFRKQFNFKFFKELYILAALGAVILMGILLYFIDPFAVQVDRWSAIHFFLQNMFQGEYPYAAQTHLGGYGSPFPVWQLFHVPFYLLGDVGLGMIFVFTLLAIALPLFFKSYQTALKCILLFLISPAFWYEAAVRSDMMYNFIICLLILILLYRKNITLEKHTIGLAILCGLMLSTRLSVVIPFVIYLLPEFFQVSWKKKIQFVLIGFFVFALTFLPFLLWGGTQLFLFEYNPFILQTRQGSFLEVVLLFAMLLFFSTRWKGDFSLCLSYIALTIVVFVSVTFFRRIMMIEGCFFDVNDITYYNMALPFVIVAIAIFSKDLKGRNKGYL